LLDDAMQVGDAELLDERYDHGEADSGCRHVEGFANRIDQLRRIERPVFGHRRAKTVNQACERCDDAKPCQKARQVLEELGVNAAFINGLRVEDDLGRNCGPVAGCSRHACSRVHFGLWQMEGFEVLLPKMGEAAILDRDFVRVELSRLLKRAQLSRQILQLEAKDEPGSQEKHNKGEPCGNEECGNEQSRERSSGERCREVPV